MNQLQLHVGMGANPQKIVSYCESQGIVVQAYSPLASGKLVAPPPPLLSTIAAAHKVSPAQVALRWIVQNALVHKQRCRSFAPESSLLRDNL